MTELKRGDRVKVSFEATYVEPSNALNRGDHFLRGADGGGIHLSAHPDVTIEVIKPEPPAQPAVAGIVEVGGQKYVRLDAPRDPKPYRSMDIWGDFFSWAELQEKGEITILFDPDAPQGAKVDPHPDVKDSEGDIWRWKDGPQGEGYYCAPDCWDASDLEEEGELFARDREYVISVHGLYEEL